MDFCHHINSLISAPSIVDEGIKSNQLSPILSSYYNNTLPLNDKLLFENHCAIIIAFLPTILGEKILPKKLEKKIEQLILSKKETEAQKD